MNFLLLYTSNLMLSLDTTGNTCLFYSKDVMLCFLKLVKDFFPIGVRFYVETPVMCIQSNSEWFTPTVGRTMTYCVAASIRCPFLAKYTDMGLCQYFLPRTD